MSGVLVERHDAVTWLTLDNSERMNALTPAMIGELETAFGQLREDAATRVVVITGAGRAFCAGADLAGEDSGDPPTAMLARSTALFEAIESFPKPVIAAVNGVACAGGLELVLCCDLVVAAQSAKIGDAHANVGLLPGAGGAFRLPRRVPRSLANWLLFTGELLPAERFVAAGLVNEVVPDADLRAAAGALATTLATRSPLALARVKQLVREGLEQSASVAMREALAMNELHLASEDAREGLAAFDERRPPQFRGK